MDLEIYQLRTDVYFLLKGRVVLEECDRLKQICVPIINKGIEQVIVDLSKVEYIDSAGLGALVGLKMTASKNKARIILLQPSRSVSDILYISKLDGIFDILTGAEADLLKAQVIQPQNRIGTPGAERQAAFERMIERPASAAPPQSAREPAAGSPASYAGSFREAAGATSTASDSPFASMDSTIRSQKEMIEEHCRKAVEYMRVGNYDMSVIEYEKALRIDPEYLPALNNLAIVYEKQPSWLSKAIDQWEALLRLSQQRGDQKHLDRAQRHLANLRQMQG